MHGCLEIWNFSSRAQLDVTCSRDIELNTGREILYFPCARVLFPIYLMLTTIVFMHSPYDKQFEAGSNLE